MSATCRCKEVEFKEGQTYKRVRGIGHHVKFSCAPNTFEDGYHDPEEDGADEKPTRKRREKKVKKPKRYKSFMSNGLKNALVIARHGMAFEQQIANYQTRKADQDLIAWAATHTCSQLRKFRMMGGKKIGELLKLVQRQDLRLSCGCPCTGVPQEQRGRVPGPLLVPAVWCPKCEGVLVGVKVDRKHRGPSCPTCGTMTVPLYRPTLTSEAKSPPEQPTGDAEPGLSFPMLGDAEAGARRDCDCPEEGSAAWEEGTRCELHTAKA